MIDYIVLMSLIERREQLYTLQRSFRHRLYYANHPFLCISSTYDFCHTPFALLALSISLFVSIVRMRAFSAVPLF